MFSLKSIGMKLFRAAKVHVLTSISIIAISVCLIVSMGVYSWNAEENMKEEIYSMFGDMDILAGYNPEQNRWVSDQLFQQIKEIEGVEATSPVSITSSNVEHIERVYTLGVENDPLVQSRYHFEKELTATTVSISEGLANVLKASVGDTLQVDGQAFTLIEIIPTPLGAEESNVVYLNNNLVKVGDEAGLFVLIKTENVQEVAKQLKAFDSLLRIDIVNEYEFVQLNLQTLRIFMIVLSVFILLITGLLLLSTFQLLFMKLKEQLMILRSIGATASQIGQIVKVQLQCIVYMGLTGGVIASFAIIKFALPQIIELLKLPEAKAQFPIILVVSIVAIMSILLFSYTKWQIKKAMQLLPMQIEGDKQSKELRLSKVKGIFMLVLLMISVFCMNSGLQGSTDKDALMILIGSLLFTLFALLVIPFIFQLLLKIMIQPIRRVFGKEAFLACQQLIPQIQHNMKVVLSLIGLMVILIFGSSVLKTVQINEQSYIQAKYETDIIISNQTMDKAVTHDLLEEMTALPSVQKVYAESNFNLMEIDERYIDYQTLDFEQMGILQDKDKKMIMTERLAKQNHLNVGDHVEPGFYVSGSEELVEYGMFELAAIVEGENGYEGAYIDWSSQLAQETLMIYDIMVQPVDLEEAKAELSELLAYWPTLVLNDKETAIDQANELFYQRWSLFIGIFIVLIIATAVGITQTLLHMVYINREQYTIQRLLGLSPNGLIKLILTQVLSFVLYGLSIGTMLGLLFTKLLFLVDANSQTLFDFKHLLIVSLTLLLFMLSVFGIQGFWISRRRLSEEVTQQV